MKKFNKYVNKKYVHYPILPQNFQHSPMRHEDQCVLDLLTNFKYKQVSQLFLEIMSNEMG